MCLSKPSRDNDLLRNQKDLLSIIISQDQKIVLRVFKINNSLRCMVNWFNFFIIATLMDMVLKAANAYTIGI